MRAIAPQEYLDKQQARNLPLIFVCATVVLLFALGRDAILENASLTEPVTLLTIGIVLAIAAMAACAAFVKFDPRFAQAFGAATVACLMARPMAIMAMRDYVFPMQDALTIFSLGICLLDLRYLYAMLLLVFIPWTVDAYLSLPVPRASAMLLMNVVAGAIAIVVLKSRIASALHLFRLQNRISSLESILPLCAHCKDTRLENGQWVRIEKYLIDTTKKRVSHGICPDCLRKHYAELLDGPGTSKAC